MPALRRDWTALVSRRPFIPDLIWDLDQGRWIPVRRQHDPGRWEALVAADDAITTQLDDGADYAGPTPNRRAAWPTSSSTAPWLMNRMLDALDPQVGMRVLEIGTGTGWNAAILAAAGTEVISVEIDREVAGHARKALAAAGYGQVTVITGDGELGALGHGPFHRILASAALRTIPYQWVEQSAEGGRIVAPYTGPLRQSGLAVLTVRDGVADGTIIGEAAFMPMRGQRIHPMELKEYAIPEPGATIRITVTPEGQQVTAEPAPDAS